MMGTASVLHASEKKNPLGSHWQSSELLVNRKTEARKFQKKFGKCGGEECGWQVGVTYFL
jgi:hypothetical protein